MKLRIDVDRRTYEVDVEVLEEPRPEPLVPTPYAPYPSTAVVPAQPPAAPSGSDAAPPVVAGSDGTPCKSPVNGVVVRVVAEVGQAIQAGDPLVVLEAMKMQTSVTAPVAGVVAVVHVQPGSTVKRDQVLAEIRGG